MADNNQLTWAGVWRLFAPYFQSEHKRMAWFTFAVLGGCTLGGSGVGAWLTTVQKTFFDSIEKRNADLFWQTSGLMVVVFVSMAAVFAFTQWLRQWVEIKWRRKLTEDLITRWFRHNTFYRLERKQEVDNADQRIADDVRFFIEGILVLGFQCLGNAGSFCFMGFLLWNMSPPLALGPFTIPGYLFFVAIIYGVCQVSIVHFIGRRLTALNFERQRCEADFRFALAQQRESAEQIALYRGGAIEQLRLARLFEFIGMNWAVLMTHNKRVAFTTQVITLAASFVPMWVMAPRLFAGQVTLGSMIQYQAIFLTVVYGVAWFATNYQLLVEWSSQTRRLIGLNNLLDQDEHFDIESKQGTDGEITAKRLAVSLPNGQPLGSIGDWTVAAGQQWLVRGPSGVGKSTLLRALAGIWPHGAGTLATPPSARVLFIPQKSYIPAGSLKEALCYPEPAGDFNDERCRQALRDCHLPQLADRLGENARWAQILSGGEQQRLAFARALLARPDFLFLDEATSALDTPMAQALYAQLSKTLPNTAVVSVAHTATLDKFHQQALELHPGQAATQTALHPIVSGGLNV
jgi:vitamin B12/bleomycin/antimicrobial peptide transport system ATP-binding/permease protein